MLLQLVVLCLGILLTTYPVIFGDETASEEEDYYEYYDPWGESSEEYVMEGEYWGSYRGLTEVPSDIPSNTRTLWLAGNSI